MGGITKEGWLDDTKYLYFLIAGLDPSFNRPKIIRLTVYIVRHFLSFHTPEQRDDFLKYNEQLIKGYLMID